MKRKSIGIVLLSALSPYAMKATSDNIAPLAQITASSSMEGYEASSAINRANKLHGELLLIHGSADDNVHLRNAAEYSEALVQADKQFDMQVYTNRNHGIFGGNTRHHLLTRVSNFFIENLK